MTSPGSKSRFFEMAPESYSLGKTSTSSAWPDLGSSQVAATLFDRSADLQSVCLNFLKGRFTSFNGSYTEGHLGRDPKMSFLSSFIIIISRICFKLEARGGGGWLHFSARFFRSIKPVLSALSRVVATFSLDETNTFRVVTGGRHLFTR